MKIGYIGLGALGGQLARRFLADHELCVWDLNLAAAQEFEKLGARRAVTSRAGSTVRRGASVPAAQFRRS
ncbi:NAD(P)-binding domain-containing protein [Polaromonas sp. P1(28)-13]|nr:NAD(P)-binding domain-containing protein [Polaromonas sp. P1(28)-13]